MKIEKLIRNLAARCSLLLAACFVAYSAMADSAVPAQWIWHPEKPQDNTTRYLRTTVEIDEPVRRAELFAAADDSAELFVNGRQIGKPFGIVAAALDFATALKSGKNVIAFKVKNFKWLGGLIVRGEIVTETGKVIPVRSSPAWRSAAMAPNDFSAPEFDDTAWSPARSQGDFSAEPWRSLTKNRTDIFREPQETPPVSQWIWFPEQVQDHSTRLFRTTVNITGKVKSAELLAAADDKAEFFLNGKPVGGAFSLKATKFNLAPLLKPGRNVLAFRVYNAAWKAGLIVRGEVFYQDGGVLKIWTDKSWKSSSEEPADWNDIPSDEQNWAPARELGPSGIEPWNQLMDTGPFRNPGASGFTAVPAAKRGRLMLDDFSDYSSWMGHPVRGAARGHNVLPYQLGFGAMPDSTRSDGGTGAIDYDFIAPGGELRFEKNSVYQATGYPEAIEFDSNPQGYECEIHFELMDRSNKAVFKTAPVRLSGDEWRRCRLELNANTVERYRDLVFPIRIRRLCFSSEKTGKGRVLLDDLAFVVDISTQPGKLAIRPQYRKLAFAPGEQVEMEFHVRNGQNLTVKPNISFEVSDLDGNLLLKDSRRIEIEPFGVSRISFAAGKYQKKGPYRIVVAADNGAGMTNFSGWFAVFEPNRQRLNRKPMWFGIEDQEIRNFSCEYELHTEWLKLLGVDLVRASLIGAQIDDVRESCFGIEQYRRMWEPLQQAGLLLLVNYAGTVPGWTGTPLASRPELLKEHLAKLAKFFAGVPEVHYVEWFNEPNLGFFNGTIEQYLASLGILYDTIKENAPQVKVATGGLVIDHSGAKKNFSRLTYQKGKYDIADFHGHENFRAYVKNVAILERWLKDAHRAGVPIGNTEAGFRSYYGGDPKLARRQAIELIQKITFTKSCNSEYYVWFMLHDYGDKYINADDSFGLVTVDNQPKPSFVAYNELIRQLANTVFAGTFELDSRLETFAFNADGEHVFVSWPRGGTADFSFLIQSDKPVTVIDMYGNSRELRPVNGFIALTAGQDPFYLRTQAAIKGQVVPLYAVKESIMTPGEQGELSLELCNFFDETVNYTLDIDGKKLSDRLLKHQKIAFDPAISIPENACPGPFSAEYQLSLRNSSGQVLFDKSIAIPCQIALPVSEKPVSIFLNRTEQVSELMFDPNSPRWSGTDDLSAEIRVSRRDKFLVIDAVVTDDDHSTPRKDAHIWQNDCLQIGIADRERTHYEFTVSGDGKGAATVWNHIGPGQNGMIGSRWDVPATVTRQGRQTLYHVEVPFEKLGLQDTAGEVFRIAFLLSDNDKGRHMRFMEYFGGIQPSKNIDLFGWAKLVK